MADPITVTSNFLGGRLNAPDPNQARVFVTHNADFTGSANIVLDFTVINQQQVFGTPRAVFIDNGSNPSEVNVYVQGTDQFFTVPSNSVGVYALDAMNNSARIEFVTDGGAEDIVTITVYNWERAPIVWYKYGAVNKDIPIKVQGAYPDDHQLPDDFGNGVMIAGISPDGKVKTINTDANGNIIVSNLDITIGAVYGPDAVGANPTHPGVLTAVLDSTGKVLNLTLNANGEIKTHDADTLAAILLGNGKLDTLIENTDKGVTGTITTVAASIAAGGVNLLAANAQRQGATIFNDSVEILYLALANTAVTNANYSVQVAAYGYYEVPAKYTGLIKGLWTAASGNARVTEIV